MFPFYYHVIDDFFDYNTAKKIESEFPDYNSDVWFQYNNPIEKKKACNNWYFFKEEIYKTFCHLNSYEFIEKIKDITGIKVLYPDIGLHGGGMHISGRDDKLNIHLDYSIHPKLKLQRKLNLIVYMSENWDTEWGGNLEFWTHDHDKNKPRECGKKINNIFNRAVLFDTTQNSWHGYPEPLSCPIDRHRKSLAVYYLTDLSEEIDKRERALYAPYKDQDQDPEVLDLIQKRVNL